MSISSVEIRPFPSGAAAEASKVANWPLGGEADFQIIDGVNICKNVKGLTTISSNLLELFVNEIQHRVPHEKKYLETRITALRFHNPIILPLEPGWMIHLIPVRMEGAVAVEGQPLEPDAYFHITQQARLSGDFVGLILLYRVS
ncbi:hypothetical protein GGR51DRAFT_571261 [Nemania sp. FL0031]|nr:hypothetical protein GGR51DRAFT_571261 [Nemania sp. FL0031]